MDFRRYVSLVSSTWPKSKILRDLVRKRVSLPLMRRPYRSGVRYKVRGQPSPTLRLSEPCKNCGLAHTNSCILSPKIFLVTTASVRKTKVTGEPLPEF